jgi:hypothetical protein
MIQQAVIVNASPLLMDEQARAYVPALQRQVDRDFLSAWGACATAVQISFASATDIPHLDPSSWPIFLNRHSNDPGALGWHDMQDGRIFSRVFVGDCMSAGLDWGATLSHELLELILDPDVKRVWRMPDGRLAALEACDAVESDDQSYPSLAGLHVSNFVLPAYFSTGAGPWDFGRRLTGPCPTLTPGGYMSVSDNAGNWTQINRDRADGHAGRRALRLGHRRLARANRQPSELEIVDL